MNAALTIARLGLQEAVRRRVFLIVAVLTVCYLALYGLGTWQAFEEVESESSSFRGVEPDVVTGAYLLGLNMFGTLFLGTILAVRIGNKAVVAAGLGVAAVMLLAGFQVAHGPLSVGDLGPFLELLGDREAFSSFERSLRTNTSTDRSPRAIA